MHLTAYAVVCAAGALDAWGLHSCTQFQCVCLCNRNLLWSLMGLNMLFVIYL
jgi:hypothetical protein